MKIAMASEATTASQSHLLSGVNIAMEANARNHAHVQEGANASNTIATACARIISAKVERLLGAPPRTAKQSNTSVSIRHALVDA